MRNVLSVIAPANRDHSIYYYEDVIDNGFLMQSTINIGNHASWPPDTAYHHFLHEPFLTADEITKINDWVDGGMPSGNPNNAPPGPVYANESFIGDPDTILTMQQHFTVPGDDSDHCKIFVIPSGFTQQKFVRALEFNPCTLANVHHIEISVDTTGTLANEEANTTGYGLNFSSVTGINQSRLLSLYHIGERVTQFPLGMGYRIPAGADLILQVHYLPTFVSIDDSISMNVFFDDTTVHQEVKTIAIDENDLIEPEFFVIKNQIKNLHHIQEICGDWSLISISPQLAIIGKSVKVFSVGTANDTTDLIQIQVWENSLRYLYYFPLAQGITSGSTIYSNGTFDNTENNPNNPYKPPANFTHDCLNCEDDFKIYLQLIGSTDCMVTAECIVSGIEEQHSISSFDFLLKPNPANDQLTISFSLPSASAITVTVYDLNERMKKIISLNAEEEKFTAGNHSITFSTLDLPQGIYFCKLQTENSISTEKLIVQR